MYPVSAALLAAIATDHVPVFRAELYLDGAYVAEVPFETGSVTVDSRRAVLRSCTLAVVPDATRTLDELWDLLAVPGAEIKLYRGVALPGEPVSSTQGTQSASGSLASSNPFTVSLAFLATDITCTSGAHTIIYNASVGTDRYTIDGVTKYFASEGGYVDSTGFRFWQSPAWTVTVSWTASGSDAVTPVSAGPSVSELVPLGVFVISEPEAPALGALGSIAINGDDRSVRIAQARFTVPYAIAAGTDLADAGAALLTSRWADCPIGFSSDDTGALTVSAALLLEAGESSDPWKEAQALFEVYGYDLYFDPDGVACIRPIPDPATTAPCIVYGNGEASVLIDAKRRVSYAETYSGIVVTGEGTEVVVPVHAEAWDMDPASPTYADGPFGRRPFFYSSPLITTQAMADTAAATMLPKHTARSSTLTWSQLVNSAHDALDVVGITDSDGNVTPYVLDTLTVPLTAGEPMAATTRATGVV